MGPPLIGWRATALGRAPGLWEAGGCPHISSKVRVEGEAGRGSACELEARFRPKPHDYSEGHGT